MKVHEYGETQRSGFAAWITKTFMGRPHRILFAAACVLLIAAAVVWLCIYSEGAAAAGNAEALLQAYESGETDVQAPITSAQPAATHSQTGEVTEPSPTPPPTPMPTEYEGYTILGKLSIDEIEQELPIIADMSRSALKVSVCYYQGAMIGEDGNMIITGHNYANGAHFGNLNEVSVGDIVVLTAPDLTEYVYEVYDMEAVSYTHLTLPTN